MKIFFLILIFPIISAIGFYMGSYIFPKKPVTASVSETQSDLNSSNSLINDLLFENNLSSSNQSNQVKTGPNSSTDASPSKSSRQENFTLDFDGTIQSEDSLKKRINEIEASIAGIIKKQKFQIKKLLDDQQVRLKKFPVLIKKAESDGYARGKAITLQLLQKK